MKTSQAAILRACVIQRSIVFGSHQRSLRHLQESHPHTGVRRGLSRRSSAIQRCRYTGSQPPASRGCLIRWECEQVVRRHVLSGCLRLTGALVEQRVCGGAERRRSASGRLWGGVRQSSSGAKRQPASSASTIMPCEQGSSWRCRSEDWGCETVHRRRTAADRRCEHERCAQAHETRSSWRGQSRASDAMTHHDRFPRSSRSSPACPAHAILRAIEVKSLILHITDVGQEETGVGGQLEFLVRDDRHRVMHRHLFDGKLWVSAIGGDRVSGTVDLIRQSEPTLDRADVAMAVMHVGVLHCLRHRRTIENSCFYPSRRTACEWTRRSSRLPILIVRVPRGAISSSTCGVRLYFRRRISTGAKRQSYECRFWMRPAQGLDTRRLDPAV